MSSVRKTCDISITISSIKHHLTKISAIVQAHTSTLAGKLCHNVMSSQNVHKLICMAFRARLSRQVRYTGNQVTVYGNQKSDGK